MSDSGRGGAGVDASRRWIAATVLVLVGYAVCLLSVRDDFGMTWDESFHIGYGRNVRRWFASGFEDRTFARSNLRGYGAAYDLAVELTPGTDDLATRWLWGAVLSVLGAAGAARLAVRLGGPRAGFFAVLLLVTWPRWVGHSCNNPVDTPFAVAYVWAVDALVGFFGRPAPAGPRRWWATSFLLALPVCVRIGGLMIHAYAGWALLERVVRGETSLRRAAGLVAVAGAVAAVLVLACYPWFQLDPIRNPLRAVAATLRGNVAPLVTLVDGSEYLISEVPRTYALIWGRSVFTEAQLLGLTGVLVLLVRGRARGIGWRITGLATVVPVVVIAATGAVIFDGIRHLLFAAVCATTLAGVGASWLVAADRHPLLRYAAGVLLAVAVARAAQVSIRLHPYESTYFNDVVVGGLAGAEGRFDTDYWGAALTEAAVWTVEHVEPRRDGRRLRVVSTHHRAQVARALHGSGFEFVGSYSGSHELFTHPYRDPPDIYIAGTRWHRDDVYPGEVVHRVARDGVTLAVVKLVDREACRKLEHGDADGAGRERPRPLEGR